MKTIGKPPPTCDQNTAWASAEDSKGQNKEKPHKYSASNYYEKFSAIGKSPGRVNNRI